MPEMKLIDFAPQCRDAATLIRFILLLLLLREARYIFIVAPLILTFYLALHTRR